MSRRGIDPGAQLACAWLTDWLGGSLTVGCRELTIPTVPLRHTESSRETYLHRALKGSARKWLSARRSGHGRGAIETEKLIFIADPDVPENTYFRGYPAWQSFVVGTFSLSPIPTKYGTIIRADILRGTGAFGVQVEVGSIDPFGLLVAQLEGLVSKSIWLPYPADLRLREIRSVRKLPDTVVAYEFKIYGEATLVE